MVVWDPEVLLAVLPTASTNSTYRARKSLGCCQLRMLLRLPLGSIGTSVVDATEGTNSTESGEEGEDGGGQTLAVKFTERAGQFFEVDTSNPNTNAGQTNNKQADDRTVRDGTPAHSNGERRP